MSGLRNKHKKQKVPSCLEKYNSDLFLSAEKDNSAFSDFQYSPLDKKPKKDLSHAKVVALTFDSESHVALLIRSHRSSPSLLIDFPFMLYEEGTDLKVKATRIFHVNVKDDSSVGFRISTTSRSFSSSLHGLKESVKLVLMRVELGVFPHISSYQKKLLDKDFVRMIYMPTHTLYEELCRAQQRDSKCIVSSDVASFAASFFFKGVDLNRPFAGQNNNELNTIKYTAIPRRTSKKPLNGMTKLYTSTDFKEESSGKYSDIEAILNLEEGDFSSDAGEESKRKLSAQDLEGKRTDIDLNATKKSRVNEDKRATNLRTAAAVSVNFAIICGLVFLSFAGNRGEKKK